MDITPERIAAVRRFNRFYTRRIGVLGEGVLHSPFTLTETRLMWELAHASDAAGLTATDLARRIPGVQRVVRVFNIVSDAELAGVRPANVQSQPTTVQSAPASSEPVQPSPVHD